MSPADIPEENSTDKPIETETAALSEDTSDLQIQTVDKLEDSAAEALRTHLQDKLISSPDDPPRFVPTETDYEKDGKNMVRFWMKPSEFGAYVHYRDYRKKIHELLHPKGLKAHAWDGTDGDEENPETWRVLIEHDLFDVDEDFVVALEVEYSEDVNGKPVLALATPSPEQAREMADALRAYADMAETQNQRRDQLKRNGG